MVQIDRATGHAAYRSACGLHGQNKAEREVHTYLSGRKGQDDTGWTLEPK